MTRGRRPSTTARSASGSPRSAACRSSAITSPSGARQRTSSWPTWPFAPSTSIGSVAIVLADPGAVGAALHVGDPGGVREVPLDGLPKADREALCRPPAELALDLAGVDRVAPVVA